MAATLKAIKHPRYAYQVIYTDPTEREPSGRPKRVVKYFTNETLATTHLNDLNKDLKVNGTVGVRMDAGIRADYANSKQLLDRAGLDTPVSEIVREHLARLPRLHAEGVKVQPLYDEFLRVKKEDENCSVRWVETLKTRVLAWIDSQAIATLGDITREKLLPMRSRKGVSARTRISDMTAVSAFLEWLVAEKWIPVNLMADIPRPKADALQPRVLTAKQVHALLFAAMELGNGRLLRYIAIATFAGLRPGEVARLEDENVRADAKRPVIRVVGGKRRQKVRVVPILPALAAWLTIAPKHEPIVDLECRDHVLFDRVREKAGLIQWEGDFSGRRRRVVNHWQADILRHTFASLRLGMTQDENLVALESGNSADVLHAHYLSILDEEEIEALQRIVPPGWTTELLDEKWIATPGKKEA